MINIIQWRWEEAFCKFGFEDGDGWNGTDLVKRFIKKKFDYDCESDAWGCHNYMIFKIKNKNGKNIIDEDINVGYDDPTDYLPKHMIKALNDEFPYHDYCEWKLETMLNNKQTEEIK